MIRLALPLAMAVACLAASPALAYAQTGACVDLCRIPCVKPISIADRWDDVTGIHGYMGGLRRPDWRNNAQFDHEIFTDDNGNGVRDGSEAFVDDNGNGVFDEELYDPVTTGYLATNDLGLEIVLHPGSPFDQPSPGQFLSVALPPVNKGIPAMSYDEYRWNWANCFATPVEPGDGLKLFAGGTGGPTNQAMRDIIAQDPDAYWDEATQQVQGSDFALSPRVLLVPAHDPHLQFTSGAPVVTVRKVLAFFAEGMVGTAEVRGRLLRVQTAGEACGGTSAGGFVVQCPVPATPGSWGRLKAAYR